VGKKKNLCVLKRIVQYRDKWWDSPQ
jgi:hypothetical protein